MCVGGHPDGLVCFLYWQVIISCILSIVGCSFVILTYFLLPKTRTPLLELVIYLSLADGITAIFFLIGCIAPEFSDHTACVIMGALRTYWFLTSFIWTCCIAVRLKLLTFESFVQKKDTDIRYHLLSWLIPAIYVLLLLLLQVTGVVEIFGPDAVEYCWIQEFYMELPFFFLPMLICLAFNVWQYYVIIHHLRKTEPFSVSKKMKAQKRVLILPFIFIICMFPKMLGDCLSAFKIEVTAIAVVQSFLLSLSGFLNALFYAVNPTVLKEYKDYGNASKPGTNGATSPGTTEASPLLVFPHIQ